MSMYSKLDHKPNLEDGKTAGQPQDTDMSSQRYPRMHVNKLRLWISSLVMWSCTALVSLGTITLRTQYLDFRIGRDHYNYSVDSGTDEVSNECENTTFSHQDVLNKIQAEVSNINIVLALAAGIPATLVCLLVGSYSDFVGRRPLMLMGAIGQLSKVGSLCAVIYFDLDMLYLYVGSAVEGICGSFPGPMSLAVTASVADISHAREGRATKFAGIEGTLLVTAALSQLCVGYSIAAWGYFLPTAIGVGVSATAILIIIFIVPETRVPHKERFQWNPTIHLSKVIGFYFSKAQGDKRILYALGLVIYMIIAIINSGRNGVETLFELNSPICWNSVEIGNFEAIRLIVWSVVAIISIRLVRNRLPLESLGLTTSLTVAAGFAIESTAKSGTYMYIAGAVSILYATAFPVPKALTSRLTPPTQQGALFSSIAFVEAAATMFSTSLFTYIYSETLGFFNGMTFIILAGGCIINAVLYIAYWVVRRRLPPVNYFEAVVPPPPQTNGEAHQLVVSGTEKNEKTPLLT